MYGLSGFNRRSATRSTISSNASNRGSHCWSGIRCAFAGTGSATSRITAPHGQCSFVNVPQWGLATGLRHGRRRRTRVASHDDPIHARMHRRPAPVVPARTAPRMTSRCRHTDQPGYRGADIPVRLLPPAGFAHGLAEVRSEAAEGGGGGKTTADDTDAAARIRPVPRSISHDVEPGMPRPGEAASPRTSPTPPLARQFSTFVWGVGCSGETTQYFPGHHPLALFLLQVVGVEGRT